MVAHALMHADWQQPITSTSIPLQNIHPAAAANIHYSLGLGRHPVNLHFDQYPNHIRSFQFAKPVWLILCKPYKYYSSYSDRRRYPHINEQRKARALASTVYELRWNMSPSSFKFYHSVNMDIVHTAHSIITKQIIKEQRARMITLIAIRKNTHTNTNAAATVVMYVSALTAHIYSFLHADIY